jgi:hypothetical protein
MRGSAKQSTLASLLPHGLLRCARNDGSIRFRILAARVARVLRKSSAQQRAWRYPKGGAGNAGCPLHPQPRARSVVSTRVSHHGRTGTPGIPARDGFNGFLRALPGDRALLSPSPPRSLLLKNLTPTMEAPGPHDFAVRKLARSSVGQLTSIASPPYVRDDRETPLCVGRDGERYAGDLRPGSRKIRKIRNKSF